MSGHWDQPVVGTGVWIRKNGKVLLGKRIGHHAKGTWSPPGGMLEMFEEWEDNVRRETMEETGLEIDNIRFVTATNNLFPDEKRHSITLYHVADWKFGEVENLEPHAHERWEWFAWDELPEPLFVAARIFLENGYNPFTI